MIEYLGKIVDVRIDRPLGSRHPKYNFYYPINYGFIPNTVAGDGKEIDVYVLGEFETLESYKGKVIAIIHRKDDNEDKLVVASEMNSYNKEQIIALTQFQERYFDSEIISFDMLKEKIRVTAKGFVRKGDEVLVIEEKENNYFRLLGGGVEFREEAHKSLIREFKEELRVDIVDYSFVGIIENIFEFKGIDAHEICFVYDVTLPEEYYNKKEYVVTAEILPANAKWINKEEFITRKRRLLPEQLLKFL